MDANGYAIVKDRCTVCGRVLYGYMKMGVPVPEPRCSKHADKATP
jgi:hypothetical protein